MRKNITKQAFDEIQRLSGLNFTRKEIAKAVGCGISTVGAIRTAGSWENYQYFKKMQRENAKIRTSKTKIAMLKETF